MRERRIETRSRSTPHNFVHRLVFPLGIGTDDRFVLLERRDEEVGVHSGDGESEEREEEGRTGSGPVHREKRRRSASEEQNDGRGKLTRR